MAPPTERERTGFLPPLGAAEWITFAILAGVLAAANIYTTLLIGWGDTGSIIAVLFAVLLLGLIKKGKPSIHTLNLGQTMVSAGGSVGFSVASYAAVKLVQPEFDPPAHLLILMFAAMGMLGAVYGATVRRQMVKYYFPSGTACAVIQRAITRPLAPGERNRPVFLLKVWGGLATLLTLPAKISLVRDGAAIFHDISLYSARGIGIGVDPLYYGIGIVVGPRVGLGMLIGALSTPFLIEDLLQGSSLVEGLDPEAVGALFGNWNKWIAIAALTLPTFATIVFAYFFRVAAVIPPGFLPGVTEYDSPASRRIGYGVLALAAAGVAGYAAHEMFGLPWFAVGVTMIVAWPMCIMNGRVTGETDINPVRLVAIIFLSAFFWMVDSGAITMLGMAVVGGTLASIAVDMMQDYRTGYLVDANPSHQTSVQLVGSTMGAIVSIPMLAMLVDQLGIGEGTALKAPGATIWASVAESMASVAETGSLNLGSELELAIVLVSVLGCVYAWLTVWPVTAKWMPSVFGIGLGLLLGVPTSAAIFLGGVLKVVIAAVYTAGKSGEAREEAAREAGNDTMLAGASIFAAAAIISIGLVLLVQLLETAGVDLIYIATH